MYANRRDVRRAVLTEHFCKNAPLHITDTLIGKLTYTSHFLQLRVLTISDHQFVARFNSLNHVHQHRIRFTFVVSFLFIIFAILILIIGDRRFTEKFGYDLSTYRSTQRNSRYMLECD